MRFTGTSAIGLAVLLGAGPCSTHGQPPGAAPAVTRVDVKPVLAQDGASADGDVLREIDDPQNGLRWLLMRDPSGAGGPGRMIPTAAGRAMARPGAGVGVLPVPSVREKPAQSLPVIRAGDRLIVEESTALVEARLTAVALGSALAGSPLNVRLVLGGNILRAVALGPGRAAFAPETRMRP